MEISNDKIGQFHGFFRIKYPLECCSVAFIIEFCLPRKLYQGPFKAECRYRIFSHFKAEISSADKTDITKILPSFRTPLLFTMSPKATAEAPFNQVPISLLDLLRYSAVAEPPTSTVGMPVPVRPAPRPLSPVELLEIIDEVLMIDGEETNDGSGPIDNGSEPDNHQASQWTSNQPSYLESLSGHGHDRWEGSRNFTLLHSK